MALSNPSTTRTRSSRKGSHSLGSSERMGRLLVTDPWPMSGRPVHFQNRARVENVYVSLRRVKSGSASAQTGNRNSMELSQRQGSLSPSCVILPPRKEHHGEVVQPIPKIPSRASLLKVSDPAISAPPPACLPWFKKIRVMKSLGKKMGMGSRGEGSSRNNLPPLHFHSVHGDNIQLTQDGAVARRAHSFCKAIAFSNRPVKIQEKVCLKFTEVSTNWSGVVRLGFTSHDPASLRSCLPKYACPDLTSRPGFWAKAFHDYLVRKDTILFYYVTHTGDVHFGINGEEVGTFFKDVDARGPLWALLDIYGNTTAIELVDPKAHLNNSRAGSNGDEVSSLGLSLQSLNLKPHTEISPINHYPETVFYSFQFHNTRGNHVELGKYRYVAWRYPNEYANGYVFTSRPVKLGETLIIQIQGADTAYTSSMAFGLTSCNPESISSNLLPDDSYLLQDRPEYWVVKKEAGNSPCIGDEFGFTVSPSGVVSVSKNGGPSRVLMHVDTTVALWAFFDLYGTTQKIAIAGSIPPKNSPSSSLQSNSYNCLQMENSAQLQLEGVTNQNLGISLPVTQQQSGSTHSRQPSACFTKREGSQVTVPSLSGDSHNAQFNGTSRLTNQSSLPAGLRTREVKGEPSIYPTLGEVTNWTVECVACCEKPVDSVFYQCGHLSMCYECAYEYWKTRQKTACPICRSTITDVIRIFRS